MAETLTEQEFVERFGTERQKEYFAEHGKLQKSYKQSILQRAEKYCVVKQLKNGKYSITKQKQVPLNPDYIKSATGLYQYTCPLILNYILNSGKDKTVIGMVSLAQKSHIVSEYYKTVKRSPDLTSQTFSLNESVAYDCIKHMADTLNYHIEQTLKYLKQMQLIVYTTNYLVFKSELRQAVNNDSTIETQRINYQPTIASDKEMEIYRKAVEEADIYAGTTKASERYYSKKAEEWNRRFHEVLLEYGITNMCEVYEIWTVHHDKCVEYRNAFEHDISKIVNNLAKDFKSKLINNATKRIDNFTIDEMELTYNFITRICIGNPQLNQRIKNKLKKIKSNVKINNYSECEITDLIDDPDNPTIEFHI